MRSHTVLCDMCECVRESVVMLFESNSPMPKPIRNETRTSDDNNDNERELWVLKRTKCAVKYYRLKMLCVRIIIIIIIIMIIIRVEMLYFIF